MTKSTAAKQHTSGNASGERKANAAQTRRRTAAAKSSANGSPSSSNGNGGSTKAGSSKAKTSSNGAKASSNGAKASSTRSKPSSTRAKSGSTRAKTATTSRTKTAASKPKDAAPKPNGSASKPKDAAPKPKGPARKPKTAPPPKGISTSANDDQNGKTSTTNRKKPDVKKPDSKDKGENPVTSGGKHLASALFSSTSHKPKKHPVAKALAKRTAKHVVKSAGRRSLQAGGAALRTVAETAGTAGRQAARAGMSRVVDHRPPVQASVDVAAPIAVVWDEWMTFEWFTEGLHQIEDVERDGDELVGRVASAHDRDWHAEIVDEREQQAFAWRSDEGTDCAGLVTFHRLSDRLTRIEADLDVLPTNPGETFLLSLPIPARRAERALQLFKAHVEFIDPDTYEDELEESDEPTMDQDESDRGEESEGHSDNDGAEEDAENDD